MILEVVYIINLNSYFELYKVSYEKSFILLFVVISSINIIGQDYFVKTIPSISGDYRSLIAQLSDSTYLLSYQSSSVNYLAAFDEEGDTIWTRSYSFLGPNVTFWKILETKNNEYLILVHPRSILKVNNLGDTIWSKSINSDAGARYFDFCVDNNNNIIVVGVDDSCPNSFGGSCGYAAKLDSLGNEILSFSNSFPRGYNYYYTVKSDSFGNYIIGGQYIWGAVQGESSIVIVDSLGLLIHEKRYLQPGRTLFYIEELMILDDGNILFESSSVSKSNLPDSTYLTKLDSVGGFIWRKGFKGNASKWEPRFIRKSSSGYLLANLVEPFAPLSNSIQLMLIDSNYNFVWQRSFSSLFFRSLSDVFVDHKGDILMTGVANNSTTGDDVYLIKTDANGLFSSINSGFREISPDLKVYPNPSKGIVTVESEVKIEILEVYSAIGKLLSASATFNTTTTTVELPKANGIYILKLMMKNGEVFSKKVIKQ